jgi:hypothetical protein
MLHNTSLDFLFADHMPKGMCQEQTVSRLMSCGRVLDEVSPCCEWMRSHMVRPVPDPFGDRLSVRGQEDDTMGLFMCR